MNENIIIKRTRVKPIPKEKTNLRKELEITVTSFNKDLRGHAENWDYERLLAYCHPLYRTVMAKQLFDEGEITERLYNKFKPSNDKYRLIDILN